MKNQPKDKTSKSRLQLLHQYYSYTGFYTFVWSSVKQAIPLLSIIIITVFVVNEFYNINTALVYLTETLPTLGVLAFFFGSETVLGLVPPEIFIAWAGKMKQPWLYLTILAMLSYVGGLLTYMIGKGITSLPKVHNYMEVKMKTQLKQSRKWGGFLIIVGALLPLPFSISCLAAGLIDFPFKRVILYGSLRLLRFLLYGLVIFHVV
ncbi:YqaA family protein [Aestuariivivens marinum]|uniref:YqaA family protein n=1 Tax=Aestuariivivens marinum TaxID=2913555 RepID=UPI001F571749|nr:VTT domain-containing protein [Aestuariivivens marinum]